jgi:hypothetical protein
MSKDREPPAGVVVASNGAWRDEKTKRFVKGGKPENMITPENSPEYHRMRQQKQADGMLQADKRLYDLSPEYWGDLAESMFYLGKGEKGGIAAVQATKMVGQMTGYLDADRAGADLVPPGGARLELGAGVVEDIFKYIQEYRDTSNE